MRGRLLDTSVLIAGWRAKATGDLAHISVHDARRWAGEVARLYGANVIATPVAMEFVAGVQSSHELTLARAFLDEFNVIDRGEVVKEDWELAKRFAERVPRDGKRRHLGDCLIKAIASRFGCDPYSLERSFR